MIAKAAIGLMPDAETEKARDATAIARAMANDVTNVMAIATRNAKVSTGQGRTANAIEIAKRTEPR